jgi:tetratricopeptide (TPR) repeat protein
MRGYSVRDVSEMLGLSASRVHGYVRAGFLRPARGPHGAHRFSFQDLLILRTAQGLLEARIPPRRVKSALRKLREQLPEGRPLTGVRITADGDRILVRDGESVWQPESGQVLLDFGVAEIVERVTPLLMGSAPTPPRAPERASLDADDWYETACDLEDAAPDQAREAYRRALEIDPTHAASLVNLGRLLQAAGAPGVAEAHYRRALAVSPEDDTAAFNLGVALEEMGRVDEALEAYEHALALDPSQGDAHYNVALLYEQLGRGGEALGHLKAYRRLLRNPR